MIDPLLLTTVPIATFDGTRPLTKASGFFFEREARLFLVTSRHVCIDEASRHYPDRAEIVLHVDADNVAAVAGFSIPLYRDGRAVWRQGFDAAGDIDVAAIDLDRAALPRTLLYRAFSPQHLLGWSTQVEVGAPLLIVGFPLGFHDSLHHLPVVRQSIVASSFGFRFQGHGYFLTDARTHRGTSGAPVVMRVAADRAARGDLPWMLLGIHSARIDIGIRDLALDEALGLNCAWYADVLGPLTGQ